MSCIRQIAFVMLQLWVPDPDEKERYWHTMDEIKTWSEEEQKHFMNNAYLGESSQWPNALEQ